MQASVKQGQVSARICNESAIRMPQVSGQSAKSAQSALGALRSALWVSYSRKPMPTCNHHLQKLFIEGVVPCLLTSQD